MNRKLSLFTLVVGLGYPCWVQASEGDRYPGPPDEKQLGGGVVISGSKTKPDAAPTVEAPVSSAAHQSRIPTVGGVRPVSAVTIEPVAPAPRLVPSTGNYTAVPVAFTKPVATPPQISSYPVIPVAPEACYAPTTMPCPPASGHYAPIHHGKHFGSCEPGLISKFSTWLKFSRPAIETECVATPYKPPYWAWLDCNNRYRWGSVPSCNTGACGTAACTTGQPAMIHRSHEHIGTGGLPGLPSTGIVSPAPVAPPAVTRLPQVDPLSSFKGAAADSSDTYKRPAGVPISRPYR